MHIRIACIITNHAVRILYTCSLQIKQRCKGYTINFQKNNTFHHRRAKLGKKWLVINQAEQKMRGRPEIKTDGALMHKLFSST